MRHWKTWLVVLSLIVAGLIVYHVEAHVFQLRVFTQTGVEQIDFDRYVQMCNVDSAYDSGYMFTKGRLPKTMSVLKEVEKKLPLAEGAPTSLGVEADGRFYIVRTWNMILNLSTDHDHYELNQCIDEEATRWGLRMLNNPKFATGITTVTVTIHQ